MFSDPYRMVVVSFISFILLVCGIFLFKHFFPKKKVNYLLLVILFSLLPIISIFRQGVYESGDFSIHIYEAMSFYDNLKQGIFFPKWGGELNATYGYPVFLFAYPLPNYLISLPHFLGISFILSLKIFLTVSFVFSGITMFYFMKEYLKDKFAFTASIFYLFAPYHLVDLHFRADIGEILAFVFLPLCLLFIKKIMESNNLKWIVLGALSFAGLILSHQAVSLSFFPIMLLYTGFLLLNKKKKKLSDLFAVSFSLILGLMLSSYYWIPVLAEKVYTKSGLFPKEVSFGSLLSYIISPWRLGFLFQGPNGELSNVIGYVQLLLVTIAFFIVWLSKEKTLVRKNLIFFLVLFCLIFFMLQEQSLFVWKAFPILNSFQFAFRLLAVTAFITSIIAGLVSKYLKNAIIWTMLLIAIATTILNWGNRRTIPEITDTFLSHNLPLSTSQGEGNGQSVPKWVSRENIWLRVIPKKHLEVVSGKAEVLQTLRTNIDHEYIANVKKHTVFKENTEYFPGWNLYIDKKPTAINFEDKRMPGIIFFKASPGLHLIKLKYEELAINKIANGISLSALLVLLLVAFYKPLLFVSFLVNEKISKIT